jgi:hypothetical protein
MHNSTEGDCTVKKIIASIVLAAGVVLAVPTAANAAACGSYGLTQSANTAAPGAVVNVTSCFAEAPGTSVTTSFTGTGAADLFNVTPAVSSGSTLGPTGAVTFQVRIPASATNGSQYGVSAATAASTYSGVITVVAPAAAPGNSGLASTGLDFAPIAMVGGGLLLIGGLAALTVVGRRRRAAV